MSSHRPSYTLDERRASQKNSDHLHPTRFPLLLQRDTGDSILPYPTDSCHFSIQLRAGVRLRGPSARTLCRVLLPPTSDAPISTSPLDHISPAMSTRSCSLHPMPFHSPRSSPFTGTLLRTPLLPSGNSTPLNPLDYTFPAVSTPSHHLQPRVSVPVRRVQ